MFVINRLDVLLIQILPLAYISLTFITLLEFNSPLKNELTEHTRFDVLEKVTRPEVYETLPDIVVLPEISNVLVYTAGTATFNVPVVFAKSPESNSLTLLTSEFVVVIQSENVLLYDTILIDIIRFFLD